jgi:hypothetical protein
MIKISYSNIKDKLSKCKDSLRGFGRSSSHILDSLENCEYDSPYANVRTYEQALEIAGKIAAQQIKEAEIGKERKKPKVDASKASISARGFIRDSYSEEERLLDGKIDVFNGIPKENLVESSRQDNPFSWKPKEPEEN